MVILKRLSKLGPMPLARAAGSGWELVGLLSDLVGGCGGMRTTGRRWAASGRTRLPAHQACPADPRREARTGWYSANSGFPQYSLEQGDPFFLIKSLIKDGLGY